MAKVEWRNVVGVLPNNEWRERCIGIYLKRGYTPDIFAKVRMARELICEQLISLEDWLEVTHPRRIEERKSVQTVRRRLELELYS